MEGYWQGERRRVEMKGDIRKNEREETNKKTKKQRREK